MKKVKLIKFLIGESFVAIRKVDYSAICEAAFLNEVLHHVIVAVGVDADVGASRETILHNGFKDSTCRRDASDSVYHAVGKCVIQPVSFIYDVICRVGGW